MARPGCEFSWTDADPSIGGKKHGMIAGYLSGREAGEVMAASVHCIIRYPGEALVLLFAYSHKVCVAPRRNSRPEERLSSMACK